MPLFDLPIRSDSTQDRMVAKKSKSTAKKTSVPVRGGSLAGQIQQIIHTVDIALGKYKDKYKIITDADELRRYLNVCRGNQYISIDTETNGLNPFQNIIAGICINTYGEQGAYIPINHVNYITDQLLPEQLPQSLVVDEFKRLLNFRPDIDMFNAAFDIRFLRAFGITSAYCTWDASIAARLLNENEMESQRGLKALHNKYCLDGKGDAFAFDDLFKGVPFTHIPLQTAYLYAAHDPVITTELCDFQRKYLYYDRTENMDARNGMNGVAYVFKAIEMPTVDVVVAMETNGVAFDFDYNRQLADKYHKLLDDKMNDLIASVAPYEEQLRQWSAIHPNVRIDNPLNFGSPKQVEVLLYEILKLDAGVDKRTKKPIRGTGEEILKSLKHPICDAILDYRALEKLVGTYIDKLPNCVESVDNRIHCNFNQYGADTGRFSSSKPNLQNLPSHVKDIRQMFIATTSEDIVTSSTDNFVVDRWCEVKTADGWKYADEVKIGDTLKVADEDTKSDTVLVKKIKTLVDKNQIVYYY